MQLTTSQVLALRKLLDRELPLRTFCDSIDGETLCWSGLVGIRPSDRPFRATVAITDNGRAELARLAA